MTLYAGNHPIPKAKRLFVFGAGGHGREVAWLAQQLFPDGLELSFVVDDSRYLCGPVNGIPVRLLSGVEALQDSLFVAAVGDPLLRRRAAKGCAAKGMSPTVLIHPRTEMSKYVELGAGTVICAGTVMTTNIRFGVHVHVNVCCTVSHDVSIGDFSTLSPGVHVSGHVRIGSDVFIGTGASIINGHENAPLVIGDGAVIAAGACVTKSAEAHSLVAGVPGIRKR